MARFAMIKDGVVDNIIEASEIYGNYIGAIYIENYPVNIGDTYDNGKFFRNNEEIIKEDTEIDTLRKENLEFKNSLLDQQNTISELTELFADFIGGAI